MAELRTVGRIVASGEDPEEAIRIRNQNRQNLQNLMSEFSDFKHQFASMRQENQTLRSEVQSMKGEIQKLNQELHGVKSLKDEIHSVKNMKSEMQQLKNKHETVHQELQKHKQVSEKVSDIHKKQSEHHASLENLKKGAQSSDKLTSLESKTNLVTMEFTDLKNQIYARGLLAPKKEEPEEEHNPDVGAIALGEDVFTARLLVHLGFKKAMKERLAAEENDKEQEMEQRRGQAQPGYAPFALDDEDDEDENYSRILAEDCLDDANVHGIADLDIEEGAAGSGQITYGWLCVCILTFVLQVLVVLILISNAEDAGEGCFEHPHPRFTYTWWLLHLSKGLAIGMAGVLMGTGLMDVVNYAMVSYLVEPRINWEVVILAAARMGLAALIAVANVVIFYYLKSPASVWINMTALAFIGELGTQMLDVARRGVFGHHIMKTMTSLNFELTFVQEYPKWFPAVRFIVLSIAMIFIAVCAGYAFLAPDFICADAVEKFANGTSVIFPGMGGGGAGGMGGHGGEGGGGGGAAPHHHR